MGQRGPKPTPTRILRARGSKLAKQRAGTEPALPCQIPPAPAWLDTTAKKEWKRLVKLLRDMGIITRIDRDLLAMLCMALSEYQTAVAEIAKSGAVVEGSTGSPVVSPWVRIRDKAVEKTLQLAPHFGLSAATRPRLQVASEPAEPDEFEQFLNKRRFCNPEV
jgi:P27 family predicted phage terminase small subunit